MIQFKTAFITTLLLSLTLFPLCGQTDKAAMEAILLRAFELEQSSRKALDSIHNNGHYEELIDVALKMDSQDKENQMAVFPIIDSIIADSIDDLSDEAYRACYYIVQHSNEEAQLKYKPFIELLYKKGNIAVNEYMWFVDRVNAGHNKAQVYGLQSLAFTTGCIVVYPVNHNYEKEWEKIGCPFQESIWDSFSGEYYPTIVYENEFVIFGFIFDIADSTQGIENASVTATGEIVASSNRDGYFSFKVPRGELPESITVEKDGISQNIRCSATDEQDFVKIYVAWE